MRGTSRSMAPAPQRSRRLLLALVGLAALLAALTLAAASPVGGLLVCAITAVGGLVLWLRSNRTVATAVISTAATMMWIPTVIDRVGQAAGVPQAIASWEVIPLWALTLAVTAGAWLPTRHTGSRAVTVVLCHLAIAIAALPAPVFPTGAVTTAAAVIISVLLVRSGVAAAWRLRLHIRPRQADHLRKVHDAEGRLWLAVETDDRTLYVGSGGHIVAVHPLSRRGRITLAETAVASGTPVRAYALNGSAEELVRTLTGFAAADRMLARRLHLSAAQVSTVVTAPHAHLTEEAVRVDLAGIWDKTAHRYVDHPVTVLARTEVTGHLHEFPVARPPRRLLPWAQAPERVQEFGDVRQRRVAAATGAC